VEVFEDELQAMADHVHTPYDALKAKTVFGQVTSYAFDVTRLGFTRWMHLPCPFYSVEQNGCLAHPVRGAVCKVYPVVFTGDDTCMSIRVTCDYGKDVVKAAYKRLRETDPGLEIIL
jgi:Fe-S-cluster containining protein